MLTRTTGFMVALLAASVLIGALPCSRHCSGQAADLRSAPKETDPASAPQPAAAPADGSDDRRIGQLTNIQGVVVLRPPRASRWTPVAEGMPLKRGDWLRTDAEEANAVSLRLLRQTDLILGPGAGGTDRRAADPHRRRRRADRGRGKLARRGPRSPGGENLDFRGAALSGREPAAVAPGKRAPLASRSRREDRQGIDRLVAGQGGRPLRAVGRRLPQGVGGHPRPDRADDDRAIVRQPDTQRAGRHFLLSPAARRRAGGLRHVDRRSLGRGRRGREAVGPRYLRDLPPSAPRPGVAGVVGRQRFSGPRVPHSGQFGEAHYDQLHPGPAAARRRVSLSVRLARRVVPAASPTAIGDRRAGEFVAAASQRWIADARDAQHAHRPLGASGVPCEGLPACRGLRGADRRGAAAAGGGADPLPPRRGGLLHAPGRRPPPWPAWRRPKSGPRRSRARCSGRSCPTESRCNC